MRTVYGNETKQRKLQDLAYKYECSLDVAAYLLYVEGVLESIGKDEVVVGSYDTGFGITLVNEDLGNSPMTLFVVQAKVRKVEPPRIKDMAQWDLAWGHGKDLINKFIAERNEKVKEILIEVKRKLLVNSTSITINHIEDNANFLESIFKSDFDNKHKDPK